MEPPMKMTPNRPRTMPSNEEILSQIRSLLECPDDDLPAALVKEILAGMLKLHDAHLDALDLKIVNRAIKELRHAFRVFRDYHGRKKVSIFGSARTNSHAPNYPIAFNFFPRIVEESFLVFTPRTDRTHT